MFVDFILFSVVGFEVPDKFVVGYALDYNEYFRDLNVSIFIQRKDVSEVAFVCTLCSNSLYLTCVNQSFAGMLIDLMFLCSISASLVKQGRRSTKHEERLPHLSTFTSLCVINDTQPAQGP